ncbi:MAG: DMT family transporter [Bacteroidales bacterium]|jgi:drug/metabolite transporter (DMT)-like permease
MMHFLGEIISIAVAVSWTLSALFFEYAGKKIGSLIVNILRLIFAFFLLGSLLYFTTGSFIPQNADADTWIWMILSGLVGFVFGDLCLFYSYLLITARFSQLLMTLAPPFAALFGWLLLGETLSPMGFVGMAVTLVGIAISVLKRGGNAAASVGEDTLIAGGSNLTVVTKYEKESVTRKVINKLSPNLRLHLPLKGLLLGIGGALGQGLGIVLSKQGMNYYSIAAKGTDVAGYIPFAATQMRIITGIIGFALIILFTRRFRDFKDGFKNRKAVSATFAGSIFGPFVGVSLSLMAIQHTNTAVASTIMATTPIIILIPYILLYKKKITFVELIGAILSVVGVSLFFL